MKTRLYEMLEDYTNIANIQASQTLEEDLCIDSVELLELQIELEDEFKIEILYADIFDCKTVGDLETYLTKLLT